jgi:hypothetical protein
VHDGVPKQVRDDFYFWIVGNGLDARPEFIGVDAGGVYSPGHCFARPALSTASRKEGKKNLSNDNPLTRICMLSMFKS